MKENMARLGHGTYARAALNYTGPSPSGCHGINLLVRARSRVWESNP